ncbi:MAG: DUF4148 domain-containing protein [Pseudomonadota bacterium]
MKKIALASLILAAGAAFAGEPASFGPVYTPGAATRAEVRAEVINAVKSDALPQTGEVGQFAVEAKSSAVRDTAAVRDEGRQAARAYATVGEV